MKHKNVIVCIIKHKDKLLLLKREPNDDIYPGRWNFVSGTIEKGEEPLQTAYREVNEETGIEKFKLKLIKKGKPSIRTDKNIGIIFHNNTFLFESSTDQITLDHENTEYVWIDSDDLLDYYLAPGMIQIAIELIGNLPERKGIMAIVYRNPDSFAVVKTRNDNIVLPTGGVEKGETPEDAVIHEVIEETGIEINKKQVKKLPLKYRATYKKGFLEGLTTVQDVFLVKVPEDSKIGIKADDVLWVKWMNRDEVRKNLTFENMKAIFEESLGCI